MKKVILIPAIMLVLFSFGCRFASIEYDPQPGNIKNKEQAKAVILKAFTEQPRRNGAQQVTVDDERISFAEDKNNLVSLGKIHSGMAIYFSTPDRIHLYRHRSSETYNVDLFKNRTKIYAVRIFSEDDAKQFMDAFKYMQDLNAKKTGQEVK
jgi:hypothetical protein